MEAAKAFGFIVLIVAAFATAILYFVQLYRFAAVLKRDHLQLWQDSHKSTAWRHETDFAIAARILQSQDLSTLSMAALRAGTTTRRLLYGGLACFFVLFAVVLWMSVNK